MVVMKVSLWVVSMVVQLVFQKVVLMVVQLETMRVVLMVLKRVVPMVVVLEKKKAVEISVPYRPRVGDAEIHTWGDGWKNFKFLFAKRLGLNRTRTPWGGRDSNPDSNNKTLPEQ